MNDSAVSSRVFLSLSGADLHFVEKVEEQLPRGISFLYTKSIGVGEEILQAMERAVSRSSIFILFASSKSLESLAVQFELSQSRFEKIFGSLKKIIVFRVDNNVRFSQLPEWLRKYWISPEVFDVKSIARIIIKEISELHDNSPYVGRGSLNDISIRRYTDDRYKEVKPNIFIFCGLTEIGRTRFAENFLKTIYPTLPHLLHGPRISLNHRSELFDMYIALRQQIKELTLSEYDDERMLFDGLSLAHQVQETLDLARHFGRMQQAVFIRVAFSLFAHDGTLLPWVKELLQATSRLNDIFLVLISNRQAVTSEISRYPAAFQIFVPEIDPADIKVLIKWYSENISGVQIPFSDEFVDLIGGHPALAKAAVRLASQLGVARIESVPRLFFDEQEKILLTDLSHSPLSPLQKNILLILSWVPRLSDDVLYDTLKIDDSTFNEEYSKAITGLILSCLAYATGKCFSISSPLRGMFRRLHGSGSDELLARFASAIQARWKRMESGHENFDRELLDSYVYMHALERKKLPPSLQKILPPSTLLEAVRGTYEAARTTDQRLYHQVIALCALTYSMRMDENVREEILGYALRSEVRLSHYAEAEQILLYFDQKGYVSRHFFHGFILRRLEQHEDAIPHFKQALSVGVNRRATVNELAICFRRMGLILELEKLLKRYPKEVASSAQLLDAAAVVAISKKDFATAERHLALMSKFTDGDALALKRRATLALYRDGDPNRALALLNDAVSVAIGSPTQYRALRAIAALRSGNFEAARSDIELVATATDGGERVARRLRAQLECALGSYARAIEILESIPRPNVADLQLWAYVLETIATDAKISRKEREEARQKALVTRRRSGTGLEFEMDW